MFKDNRYINAGTNEIYRYGKKARARVAEFLEANKNGFYSIPADGGKWWTFGTSNGKFGEYAKWGDTFFSVNRGGFVYAKEGTEKGEAFKAMLKRMIEDMQKNDDERIAHLEDLREDDED